MPPNTFEVPLIDIAPYVDGDNPADKHRVARQIDTACREVGFIQIHGHAVPDRTIAGLASAMDAFFGQPLADKMAYRLPPAVNRGYSPPRSEALRNTIGVSSPSDMNDYFEAFNIGAAADDYPDVALSAADYPANAWPTDIASFEADVLDYFHHARRVAHTLTTIFADALHLDPGYFAQATDHSIDVLRMNNYALPSGTPVPASEATGMGEHTDFGFVTVLWADRVPGLQVLGGDHRWHDVVPAPGALLVNLGDMAARLTNDRWLSTLHRVQPPIVDGTIQRRRSAAFFHDGNVDFLVEPLPSCVAPGTQPSYRPITVRDHLIAKLNGSRNGQPNPYAEREASRVLAAQPPRTVENA
ncbi:isopenicillin N synthase family dioxygenase [Nocardia sp. NPDC058658]|uniref:isopenicillin N synthase family dioxygenase n=1 Tax=Nocardia sp. NPDC058658 TaxID=3346580 RepID=UPI00364FEFCD